MQGALRFLFTQEDPQPHRLEIGVEGRHRIVGGHRDIWIDPRDQHPLYIICQTVEEIKDEAFRLVRQIAVEQWRNGEKYFISPNLFVASRPFQDGDWDSLYTSYIKECTREDLSKLTGKEFFARGFDLPPTNPYKSE